MLRGRAIRVPRTGRIANEPIVARQLDFQIFQRRWREVALNDAAPGPRDGRLRQPRPRETGRLVPISRHQWIPPLGLEESRVVRHIDRCSRSLAGRCAAGLPRAVLELPPSGGNCQLTARAVPWPMASRRRTIGCRPASQRLNEFVARLAQSARIKREQREAAEQQRQQWAEQARRQEEARLTAELEGARFRRVE